MFSDLLYHARPVIRSIHTTCCLVPVERADNRALDGALGERAMQAACKEMSEICVGDGRERFRPPEATDLYPSRTLKP